VLKLKHLVTILFSLGVISTYGQFYNGTQIDFGKNRVQYDDFEWQYFRFEKYETYFYTGGREIAVYTSKFADENIKELESFFDFKLSESIQFVIYNNQSDFKQSNVGLSDQNLQNIGGVLKIVGSKVFIYYEGDYAKLEQQIRAGIAEILLNQMMFGGDWKEVLKNSALMSLPDWYLNGLISYVSKGWTPEIANRIKDGVISDRYKKFNRLNGEEGVIAGHAMWHYIAQVHGKSVIPNILYMAKISRNVENGFLFVLGLSVKSLNNDWVAYYKQMFELEDKAAYNPYIEPLKIKSRKGRVYSMLKAGPNGKYAAYTSNHMGKYKVFIYDLEKQKKKRIYKKEPKLDRLVDYTFPQLAWHPSGELLTFITERKGRLWIHYYNIADKKIETQELFNLEKVLDFSYSQDGKKIVFSATNTGLSDIYVYTPGANTQKKITDDIYDDLHPKFIDNSSRIVFSSNRDSDTLETIKKFNLNQLPNNHKDIFIYDLESKSEVLTRVTNTPNESEVKPDQLGKDITYITESNNVLNRFIAEYDSAIASIDTAIHYRYFFIHEPATNYKRNILEYDINNKSEKFSEILFNDGKYNMYVADLSKFKSINQKASSFQENNITNEKGQQTNLNTLKVIELKDYEALETSKTDDYVDIDNYSFNGEYNQQKNNKKVIVIGDSKKKNPADTTQPEFKLPAQRYYFKAFATDQSITQLNSQFMNGQYQVFNGGPYISPGLGAVLKFGIKDLFEDISIYGGFRYSGIHNKEFMIGYQNLTNRLDKEWNGLRTENRVVTDFFAYKINSNTINYSLKWPFSEVTSLRGTISGRYDQIIIKSTDNVTLETPNFNEYWTTIKGAFVYDNTRQIALNIPYGTKFSIFGEAYQELNGNKSLIGVLGADFRHYQKIHRELIWVNRVAGSASFGKEKIAYYLGSVDEWLILGRQPRFNDKTNIDFSQNYRFQSLAANMRGFNQNIRNGSNFAVINSELRWPIFNYFSAKPIRSEFINNFQVVGFFDVGSAWNGWDPYSEDNLINTEVIERGPITVTLYNRNEPIVAGYGFGLRSKLLGYFVRTDWGWGIENGVVKDPIFYLSLSLDI